MGQGHTGGVKVTAVRCTCWLASEFTVLRTRTVFDEGYGQLGGTNANVFRLALRIIVTVRSRGSARRWAGGSNQYRSRGRRTYTRTMINRKIPL